MFVYRWSVLALRFGLPTLSFYPMGSFVLRVQGDSFISCLLISMFPGFLFCKNKIYLPGPCHWKGSIFTKEDEETNSFICIFIMLQQRVVVSWRPWTAWSSLPTIRATTPTGWRVCGPSRSARPSSWSLTHSTRSRAMISLRHTTHYNPSPVRISGDLNWIHVHSCICTRQRMNATCWHNNVGRCCSNMLRSFALALTEWSVTCGWRHPHIPINGNHGAIYI